MKAADENDKQSNLRGKQQRSNLHLPYGGEREGADNDCQAMNTYDSSPHLSSPVGEGQIVMTGEGS
ncbi:hypothetical protein ST43_06575 [Prevotella pectinovora]|nr:hypothetical protein ST43_06575 [Prevotella pectinovora]